MVYVRERRAYSIEKRRLKTIKFKRLTEVVFVFNDQTSLLGKQTNLPILLKRFLKSIFYLLFEY